MATHAATPVVTPRQDTQRERTMPFAAQVLMLTRRTLVINLRVPATVLPSLIISVFFLLVYNDTLGGASGFLVPGANYLGFVLPFSVVSAALSGSSLAGQSIVRDIENGYFDKLSLTPISRWALLLGPMIAGALVLMVQTAIVVGIALLMGLRPDAGIVGVLGLIGFSLLLGIGFSGFTVGVALLTGNAAATGGAGFLFFPLSFLAPTFVPFGFLTGWIKVAATYNPITYILEASRDLMADTGTAQVAIDTEVILRGLSSSLALGAVLFAFALYALRVRTRRR